MAEKNQKVKNEKEEFAVEEAFARLDEIAKALDDPDVSLKDSLLYYEEGVKLIAACKESLEGVEKEIQILNEI